MTKKTATPTLPAGFDVMVTESVRSARRRNCEGYEFEPGWAHAYERATGQILCGLFNGEPLYDCDDTAVVSCPHCKKVLRSKEDAP